MPTPSQGSGKWLTALINGAAFGVLVFTVVSLAPALIDRWRGAKRNYRDNTPEHSAPVCSGKGIKLVECPINVSFGEDGGNEKDFALKKCPPPS